MTSIVDRLTDIQQRIAETERRIAELKRARTVEAFLFIEMASAVLIQLREYQKRLRSNLPSATC